VKPKGVLYLKVKTLEDFNQHLAEVLDFDFSEDQYNLWKILRNKVLGTKCNY